MAKTKTGKLAELARDLPKGDLQHSERIDQGARFEAMVIKDQDGLVVAEFRNKAAYALFCAALDEAR